MKKHKPQHRSSPIMFETLENRQMLSASPVIKPATTFASSTGLYISDRVTTLGQTLTIKATVASTGGIPKGGTVELLNDNKDTGLVGTVNHLGYYVFSFDAGNSLYVADYTFRIRFLTSGDFVGSISRNLTARVVGPAVATESDGLELATVVAGTGATATAGESATVQYTGFYSSSGEEFDESASHSPGTYTFTIEASPEQVIAGFDQEVEGMQVGQTDVAVIPSALGYGDGMTRIFIVHLVSLS
jgi:hypothetical protein